MARGSSDYHLAVIHPALAGQWHPSRDGISQPAGVPGATDGARDVEGVENPCGSLIQQFFANGEAIEADRDYTVAFITTQEVPKKYRSNRRELPISGIDALRRYFSNHSKVNADLRGAVVAV
jgi:hypothetical protein